MQEKVTKLYAMLNEIYDLNATQSILGWDQKTYMPPGGAEGRGYQLATLARIVHARSTSDELGQLLEELKGNAEMMDPESDDACLITLMAKEFEKNRRIDPQWVEEFERVTANGNLAWRNARAASDFDIFQPILENIIELAKAYAGFFAPYDHVYDPLLNEFEPGMKTSEVIAIFNTLRPQQVEFIHEIAARPQAEDRFLYQSFPEQAQQEFSIDIVTRLGFSWETGRLDVTAHPFTTSFGRGDVRITTRFDPNKLNMALFASIHECGHALYDLGFPITFARTPLAHGASAAFHESQSRLYENLVGRSKPFWKFFYPRLQEKFPTQLGNVDLESFYRAVNRVKPSLIRVEADEATYNLHIMLRLELEIALLEGTLQVRDLPEAWNERMQSTLGLTPPDVAAGVLQDIHWSMGSIGYFPTYALGNLVSVQLWERLVAEIPDIEEQFESGEFEALLDWLRRNVHVYGRKFTPQVLMEKITGSKIDPAPYMRYLKQKYGGLYGL